MMQYQQMAFPNLKQGDCVILSDYKTMAVVIEIRPGRAAFITRDRNNELCCFSLISGDCIKVSDTPLIYRQELSAVRKATVTEAVTDVLINGPLPEPYYPRDIRPDRWPNKFPFWSDI